MQHEDELEPHPYDRIAEHYDDRWTPHVRVPQRRLTVSLAIERGERVVDLGCGTGVDTMDMLELASPGEVVAVDRSVAMLRAAAARAKAMAMPLTTVCAGAEEYIASAERRGFDVLSVRFALAYVDWPTMLAEVGALLRPGGRAGVLTNLATSTPQAWSVYVTMARELAMPVVAIPVPATIGDVESALAQGGLRTRVAWRHGFRLWFASGLDAVSWMRESGYVTHPELERVDPAHLDELARLYALRLEREHGETRGVPLDFDVAGVVAER